MRTAARQIKFWVCLRGIAGASYAADSECRGRHIGERPLLDSLARAKSLGLHTLQFNAVVRSNLPAGHLYERLEFAVKSSDKSNDDMRKKAGEALAKRGGVCYNETVKRRKNAANAAKGRQRAQNAHRAEYRRTADDTAKAIQNNLCQKAQGSKHRPLRLL